jgi:hypothetical protein
LREKQNEVEHLPWIDGPLEHEVDQLRQILANGRRTAVQMDMQEEQLLARSRLDGWPE